MYNTFTQFTDQNDIRYSILNSHSHLNPCFPSAHHRPLIYPSCVSLCKYKQTPMCDLICQLLFYTKGYVHMTLRASVGKGDGGDHHIPESPATKICWAQRLGKGQRTRVLVAVGVCSIHLGGWTRWACTHTYWSLLAPSLPTGVCLGPVDFKMQPPPLPPFLGQLGLQRNMLWCSLHLPQM